MYKKLKNLLSALGYIGFFCGYFYILFFNLVGGFAMNGMETQWEALKILLLSFIIAAGFPGIICYQHHRIYKLEKELDDLYDSSQKKQTKKEEDTHKSEAIKIYNS